MLQVLADFFASLKDPYRGDSKIWRGRKRTFFLGSPGGADSSLRILSRRPRTRSVGVRCFVLKKFIASLRDKRGKV